MARQVICHLFKRKVGYQSIRLSFSIGIKRNTYSLFRILCSASQRHWLVAGLAGRYPSNHMVIVRIEKKRGWNRYSHHWVYSLPDIYTSSVLVLAIVCFWVTMFLALKIKVNAMFNASLQITTTYLTKSCSGSLHT